jgi:hypothetical protein
MTAMLQPLFCTTAFRRLLFEIPLATRRPELCPVLMDVLEMEMNARRSPVDRERKHIRASTSRFTRRPSSLLRPAQVLRAVRRPALLTSDDQPH